MVDVQLGLFDTIPQPEFEVFTSRKQDWEPENPFHVKKEFETLPGWVGDSKK